MADKTVKTTKVNGVPKADLLTKEQLSQQYGYALNVIYGIPEMSKLFQQAVKEQWDVYEFRARLMGTSWWKENNEYARAFITAQAAGGADYTAMVDTARAQVQAAATKIGRQLSDSELKSYADLYMSEGWGAPGRQQLMMTKLAEGITLPPTGAMKGSSGDLAENLKGIAKANGVTYSDDFFVSAAKSVASGLSTEADWQRHIRTQAATMYPAWSDKINAGVDAQQLASGYINRMAQTLEIDPNTISLNDPYLREAFGQMDKNGNATPMSMWEFEQKLRNDPRYMKTKQAEEGMYSAAEGILKMFGVMG